VCEGVRDGIAAYISGHPDRIKKSAEYEKGEKE
jgi:hypothetical protein